MARVIIKLFKNQDLQKRMSINARILFEKKYDWNSQIIPMYKKLYKSVLAIS